MGSRRIATGLAFNPVPILLDPLLRPDQVLAPGAGHHSQPPRSPVADPAGRDLAAGDSVPTSRPRSRGLGVC
jgi:hypothetical protein